MKQHWNEQELVESWTLTESEKQLLYQRTEQGRLGLAVMLKFFQHEGRFPLYHKEAPLLKALASQKLYRLVSGRLDDYTHLQAIL